LTRTREQDPRNLRGMRIALLTTGGITMPHEQYQTCIEACAACATACEHCATACLSEAEVKKMAECIRLDRDCADICRLADAFMSRGTGFSGPLCSLCATICEACATECEKHPMDHCKACAAACRRCAVECRKMAA
jgi:hypothetical protein